MLSLDGQALVRPGRTGPLRLDGDVDPRILDPGEILTLSEEEADVLGESRARGRGHARLPRLDPGTRARRSTGSRSSRSRKQTQPERATPSPSATWPRAATGRAAARRRLQRLATRLRAALRTMRALVETVDGVFELDLEEEEVLDFDPDGSLPRFEPLELPFPGVVAADA